MSCLTEFPRIKICPWQFWSRMPPVLATGLIVLITLPFLFFATFSDIRIYDDEGTLLITFREILNGRVLYRDISALYGPFYYFCIAPLFSVLNIPLTHNVGRLISALFWLSCSLTFASLVWRLTSSIIVAAFSLLTALFFLKVIC